MKVSMKRIETMNVHVLHKLCSERQCGSSEEIEIFETKEDADRKLADSVESVGLELHDGVLKWTAGDFYNEWWVEETEVHPRADAKESALVEFARSELAMLEKNLDGDALEMQKLADEALLDLVKVFGSQGHSGFSASYVNDMFHRLVGWKPLSALTGEDDEWGEELDGDRHTQQNRRYPSLFRENHDNSTAHCVDSVIFSDDGGLSWFSCGWMRKMYDPLIVFPWFPAEEPRRIYIRWIDEDARKFEDVTYNEDVKKALREAKEKEMEEKYGKKH